MLRRVLCLMMILAFAGIPAVSAEVINATSAVAQAVVYPSSARVTRTVKVTLHEGAQMVRLEGFQPTFDENSLSVSGRGSAAVKILGTGIKAEVLKEAADERVRALEAAIQKADDELAALQGEAQVLDDKKAFLDSVRMFTTGQLPKDLAAKVPTTEELTSLLAFVESGARGQAEARQALMIRQRAKTKEREQLQAELGQVRSNGGTTKRFLTVDLECEKAGDLTLELSYTMPQAGWYPLYDARAEFEKGKVVLSAYAVVRQTTGEDWADVPLTLSTARPSLGGRMPELSPWYLQPFIRRQALFASAKMASDGIAMKSRRAFEADAGTEVENYAAPASAPAAVAYAQSETSGVALVYKPARPVTVKSDGSEARVPLMTQTLEAKFEYAATPKLSAYAYLDSSVTNSAAEQLLAGRVNIFLDGTYVSSADIAKTVAPGAPFDLYLGVDEGVTVKRELLEQKSDDTLIGNIPSLTRKVAYKYKVTVENFKPRAVTLKLFDQIPVAQDDKIKVTRVETSVKPDTDTYKDRAGVYLWTLALAPKEKKEIVLSYVVECPRDMQVGGL